MLVIPAAGAVLIVGAVLLYYRVDIRLVLMSAAAVLFAVHASQPEMAGQRASAFAQFFVEFAKGLSNPQSIVPICSAMGFAYVCKLTGCDAHLVHLLLKPLRRVRWLLVPGGIAVAFFVNSAIVSQTSTVSVVGPVLIPLMLAAGFSRVTAGSALLLGGSMGGELLNPAAVEVTAIKIVTGRDALDIIRQLLPYNLLACSVAMIVFWLLTFRYERNRAGTEEAAIEEEMADAGSIAATMSRSLSQPIDRINLAKALVPLVPIFLLVVVRTLLVKSQLMPTPLVPTETNKIAEQATIAAAMLIGVVCAALASPRQINKLPATFFEGAGFAFAHVITIITAAAMFAESVKVNGLIEMLTTHLKDAPHAVAIASIVIPWIFACVTGTAVGTAPLVINIILPIAMGAAGATSSAAIATGVRIGSVNAIAAQYGRTSSPVAPVTIMCATLARSRVADVVKRVFPPLLAGGVALLIAVLWAAR
jgi:DcuC family C4-dicarboxylate transporter